MYIFGSDDGLTLEPKNLFMVAHLHYQLIWQNQIIL